MFDTPHIMQHTAEYFDSLFAGDSDPWRFKSRWYESRKRALTLACLPLPRYASGYEPGCANGELSAALAARCDRLLVSDGSAAAVAMAEQRLAAHTNTRVEKIWVPADWPAESFDLIVLSEFGFYLGAQDLAALGKKTAASLRPGGTVLACHWRRSIVGCEFSGDEVNQRLFDAMNEVMTVKQICQILEPDMRLEVWSTDERSVAEREGFA